MADPREKHQGYDPTVPPPHRKMMGVEIREKSPVRSWRPSGAPGAELLRVAKRWSPAGIAAALILMFYVIGGHDGVAKLSQALSDSSTKEAESRKELTAAVTQLTVEVAAMREQNARMMARQHAAEKNLSSLCDFVSEINGGRPNQTWCSADSRSIRVDIKQSPPPFRTTGESWIYVP